MRFLLSLITLLPLCASALTVNQPESDATQIIIESNADNYNGDNRGDVVCYGYYYPLTSLAVFYLSGIDRTRISIYNEMGQCVVSNGTSSGSESIVEVMLPNASGTYTIYVTAKSYQGIGTLIIE